MDLTGGTFEFNSNRYFMPFEDAVVIALRDGTKKLPDGLRKQLLGRVGEFLAPILLKAAKFSAITNLNNRKPNHEDADFLADRQLRYFISVKARNKWERPGPPLLNKRYKLESINRKANDALRTAASYGAEFAWLTIQLDFETYCAYYGTYAQLCSIRIVGSTSGKKLNGSGVMMTPDYTRFQWCPANGVSPPDKSFRCIGL